MAWRIALVVDTELKLSQLDTLVRQMPVWAVNTAEREANAASLRAAAGDFWEPDPALTLFDAVSATPTRVCIDILSTAIEHHPYAAVFDVRGAEFSDELSAAFSRYGYLPAEAVRYAKPFADLEDVRTLYLDAGDWVTANDFYDSFFRAVEAPTWHGRNFNALRDSIVTGGINNVELPYLITIQNLNTAKEQAKLVTARFVDFVETCQKDGYPVSIQVI